MLSRLTKSLVCKNQVDMQGEKVEWKHLYMELLIKASTTDYIRHFNLWNFKQTKMNRIKISLVQLTMTVVAVAIAAGN